MRLNANRAVLILISLLLIGCKKRSVTSDEVLQRYNVDSYYLVEDGSYEQADSIIAKVFDQYTPDGSRKQYQIFTKLAVRKAHVDFTTGDTLGCRKTYEAVSRYFPIMEDSLRVRFTLWLGRTFYHTGDYATAMGAFQEAGRVVIAKDMGERWERIVNANIGELRGKRVTYAKPLQLQPEENRAATSAIISGICLLLTIILTILGPRYWEKYADRILTRHQSLILVPQRLSPKSDAPFPPPPHA